LSFNEDGEAPNAAKDDESVNADHIESSEIAGGEQDEDEHDQMDFDED